MNWGLQKKFAERAGMKTPIYMNQILSFNPNRVRNASAPLADRLAALTETDIRIWLKSSTLERHLQNVEARRKAIEAWAEKERQGERWNKQGAC